MGKLCGTRETNLRFLNLEYYFVDVSEKERNKVKFGLMNIRQFQLYLNVIYTDLKACSNRLSTLDQDLLGNLTELQQTIASHLSLPSKEVFPQFMRLGTLSIFPQFF